jgi:hypothetical protein
MGHFSKRFSNQNKEEILRHLTNLLKPNTLYHLSADPLEIFFEIRESNRPPRPLSDKRMMVQEEFRNFSKKKRRLSGTRKRVHPKIRSIKRGRTVNLKGIVY